MRALSKRDSRTSLCLRRSPLPGDGISESRETIQPKSPARYHWSLQTLEPARQSLATRDYSLACEHRTRPSYAGSCLTGIGNRLNKVSGMERTKAISERQYHGR